MTDTEKNEEKQLLPPLTDYEKSQFERFKSFMKLDKSSQDRLRTEINETRNSSPSFRDAFDSGLGSLVGAREVVKAEPLLGSLGDVLSHPIEAAKGKIGEVLLKHRNKASEIRVYPDPVLKEVARAWNFEEDKREDLIEIVRKLGASLKNVHYGDKLGMAAPQIGISRRVFICQGAVCVNPTWTPPSAGLLEEVTEGCYSVPNKLYKTKRNKYGWASWYSVEGEKRSFKLKGLDAIVFQHELDHLDGKCCCDIGVEIVQTNDIKNQDTK